LKHPEFSVGGAVRLFQAAGDADKAGPARHMSKLQGQIAHVLSDVPNADLVAVSHMPCALWLCLA
jgi:hypothetical protein